MDWCCWEILSGNYGLYNQIDWGFWKNINNSNINFSKLNNLKDRKTVSDVCIFFDCCA